MRNIHDLIANEINELFKEKNKEGKPTYLKVIQTGDVLEIYEYEKMPKLPKKKIEERGLGYLDKYDEIEFDNSLTDRVNNQHKSRNQFRRLITANFDDKSKFITLTFKDNLKDVRTANKEFKKFIQKMRYRYGNFKYANVIQFQNRGAVHYHMMSDLPYIPHEKLMKIWGHGFVGINEINHVDNVGAYMMPYMSKDMNDTRLMGEKSYMTSKNLIRPVEILGDEAEKLIKELDLENKKTVYNSHYTTEHLGTALYRQFNLNR